MQRRLITEKNKLILLLLAISGSPLHAWEQCKKSNNTTKTRGKKEAQITRSHGLNESSNERRLYTTYKCAKQILVGYLIREINFMACGEVIRFL